MIDPGRFEALTFDCYGTLVDWESGLAGALRPVLERHGVPWPGDDAVLERFARHEVRIEAGPYRRYRDVLAAVLDALGEESGFRPSPEERAAFGGSVSQWPVFADTRASLLTLSTRYRLAVVSNVDDDLFAGSAARIGVPFHEVVTAEQVRSYKPAPGHFHEVVRRLDVPVSRVLHVAQSLFHDIRPARALGFTCVWVNRRRGRSGAGATPPADASPDLEVSSLAELADRLGLPG
ncbi:MAG TPA: haloacid dehalogenase type II [Longimicrobiales bacterium]|nr:haloacid dehalogenase type II [Longimicrobiales bacterium]